MGYFFDSAQGKELIRANVFTEHGASTQTCLTMGEASAAFNTIRNRKPLVSPDQSYRQRPGPWND